ncbi:MAG: nicotinamide-nucleotide amidase [Pseudohongiellaceae bacterium]|jgi:nicotinamide-nucleotide amidase
MTTFSPLADQIAKTLIATKQTICVAESSTGGLIAANLLSVAGASAYFVGGSVVYSLKSRHAFLDLDRAATKNLKPLTEAMVLEFAKAARRKLQTTWAIAELGAAGPSGTPYGHAAGTSVIGIAGPINATITLQTGSAERAENMLTFTHGALQLLVATLGQQPQ